MPADLIFRGGRVYTVDAADTVAESVAISGRPQSPAWKYHPELGWVVGVRVKLPRRTAATAAEEFEEVRG